MQGIRTPQQPNLSNQIQPTMIQNPMSQMAMKRQPSGSANNSIDGQPTGNEVGNQFSQIPARKGPLGQRSGSMAQAVDPSSEYNQFTHSAERVQGDTGDQRVPNHPSQVYAQNQLAVNQRRNSASQIQMANEKLKSSAAGTPKNLYEATKQSTQSSGQAQSVTRLHEKAKKLINIPTSSNLKLKNLSITPTASSNQPKNGANNIMQFVGNNKGPSKAANSDDRTNQQVKAPQAQPMNSTQNFRSPSQLNMNPSKAKINVKLTKKTNGSGSIGKNQYGVPNLAQTLGGPPQGQKKGNWANSLSQYNSGSSMAKTFDKKSSLKLMASTNLANQKKSINSSNQSQNQESFKEQQPKKTKIHLKNKNFQQSSPPGRNEKFPGDNMLMASGVNEAYDNEPFNPNSSDYYRTTKQDDGEANVPKHPINQSPSRGGLSKLGGAQGSALSLKQKMHPLQKATFKSSGMFDQSKDPKRKTQSKFGQPKNSVKPPTKKSQFLPLQSYNPQLHQGAKIKQSHSSLQMSNNSEYVQRQKSNSIVGSGHQQLIQAQSQDGQAPSNVYSQLSDRVKRKSNYLIQGQSPASVKQVKKGNSQHYLTMSGSKSALGQAAHAVRASSQAHPQQSPERVSKKYALRNTAQSHDRQPSLVSASSKNFSSQERVLRMAAEEQEKLDEMIAQNQQRNIDMGRKRQAAPQMNQAQKNMQALSSKAGMMASKVGAKKTGPQSPVGAQAQGPSSPMINLNNVQKAQKDRQATQLTKMNASPQQMVGNIDKMQQFQKMQNNQRHSPIDLPSSSNTSKQSNGTQTGNSTSFGAKNQFPPEVRQIGHQFTEIVKCLQNIEDQASGTAQHRAEQSPDPIAPQISNIIAKLYSVKSAYEQTISNMARQNHANQMQLHQQAYSGQQQKHAQENAPSQYTKLTPHGANEANPPLSASTRSRGHLAGTGGSNNKCKHCKGKGYAPSSNSVSERQTYAGASARVENANDQQLQLGSEHSGRGADPLRGGKSVQQPLTKAIGGAELVTINLEQDPYKHQESQEVAAVGITKSLSASSAKHRMKSEKSDSFRKVFQQIQKLTEDNKKISQLEEQYSKLKTQVGDKDKMLASVEKKLAAAQSQVASQLSEQKLLRAKIKDLEGSLAQQKQKGRSVSPATKARPAKHSQTDDELLTEKEISLLVELKKLERKMRKVEKEKVYNQNKISKFIYFFFTLQNKGIPVNEIYEKDGVKFIKTDRFQEIMAQNGQSPGEAAGEPEAEEEKGDKEDELSFYSDDSFEYCPFKPELAVRSKFRNIHKVHISPLDFEGLPEYETTDEEEEGEEQEGQEHPQSQSQLEMMQAQQFEQLGINSPTPHNRLNQFDNSENGLNPQGPVKGSAADVVAKPGSSQKKQMNQKDYQKSMQYIEKFYQQNQQAQDSPKENNSGVMFDDAPQSVTENSSIFENEGKMKTRKMSKQPKRSSPNPDEILGGINQNFDKSDKFDESMMSYQSREMKQYRKSQIGLGVKDAIDVLGVSIDSQSFDQSLIDQSMNSGKKKMRRSKKKKEDLDGSKLYRDNKDGRGSNLDSNKQSSQGLQNSNPSPPQPKKKKRSSPIKQKQSLGAVMNQKGRLLDSKIGKRQHDRSKSRGGQSISSGNASGQFEGGSYF